MIRYILLHGLGQEADSWAELRRLMDKEQTFDTPELSHFLVGKTVSYETLYETFSAYCDGFKEPLCLTGLSLGGVLALHYGIQHPEKVRGLVLMGAQFSPPKALMAFQNVVFRLLPESSFGDTGFGKQDFLRLYRTMGALDLSAELSKVSCPVLVLCGEKDRANLPASRTLAQGLSNARLEVLPGCGHELNTQAPEALAQLLLPFFRGL